MEHVQEVSQDFPVERNTRKSFVRSMTLLWSAWFSILMHAHENDYAIYLPRGTTTPAGGKLLVTTCSAPQKVRGEACRIGYIDAQERSYSVYQIHLQTAFFSDKFVPGLLFVLDNNAFHEHKAWSALEEVQ